MGRLPARLQPPGHRRVGRATYDAIYPAADDPLFHPEQAAEGLTPHRPQELLLAGTDQPDVYLDVEPVLEQKLKAVFAHRSQLGRFTRRQLLGFWRERSREVGVQLGVDPAYVESFRRVSWGRS